MADINQAKRTLVFYFRLAFKASGTTLTKTAEDEIEEAIDAIIAETVKHTKNAVADAINATKEQIVTQFKTDLHNLVRASIDECVRQTKAEIKNQLNKFAAHHRLT